MDDILNQIKISHQTLIILLDEVHQSCRSYNEAKPKIRELQNSLFNHFARQKDVFYKPLMDHFKANRVKSKELEFLQQNLKEVKIKSLIFFDAHPGDMSDLRPGNFIKDFQEFSAEVCARMKTEKEYLLPLLELSLKKADF